MLLAEVAERGDVASLMTAVRDTPRAWVGVGPVFLATADPVTGSFTGTFTFDVPDDAAAAFSRSRCPAGTSSRSTRYPARRRRWDRCSQRRTPDPN
jgi:hypothetical protein